MLLVNKIKNAGTTAVVAKTQNIESLKLMNCLDSSRLERAEKAEGLLDLTQSSKTSHAGLGGDAAP